MKNFTFTLLFLGLFSGLSAQFVTIPDANFRNRLIQLYPSCFNANQQMDTTCNEVVNATGLSVNNLGIASLDGLQYFDILSFLDCSQNQLTSLPPLSLSLSNLFCSHNLLTSLPSSFQNNYSFNEIDCSHNQLTSLPQIFWGPAWFNCSYNQLTSLPQLGSNVLNLDCSHNQLTGLPTLTNSTLESLLCSHNQLRSIPALPDNLSTLNCSNNQLTTLPATPYYLQTLDCSHNQLTILPTIENRMFTLNCAHNQLTSLSDLSPYLNSLDCSHNQLANLPVLPSGMISLETSYNPALSCLPMLPITLNSINFSNTAITCLPNYTTSITPATTSVPLCTNPSQYCQTNPMAKGIVYNDVNRNRIRDASEVLVDGITILVSPNNWTSISDATYGYIVKLDTLPVVNIITPGVLPYRTFTPSSYTVTTTSLGLQPTNYDFAMQVQPNVTDLVTHISTWVHRPGLQTFANINVENIGTINQSNVSVSLEIPSGLSVVSVTPANGIVTGNTVTWSGQSIAMFEIKNYSVRLLVPTTMPLGTSLTYTAQATPATTDLTPANNIATETVVVRNSHDPNDKQVNKDRLPNNYVAADEEMLYTIRFQNTGTDTAFTVLIRDTLDLAKLDFSTFRITGASHALRTNVRDHGVVEFVFNNILLPDSFVNEPLSHGYVQFRIHPKANLALGTQIKNRAFIYFDFNTPIITNFATTTVGLLSLNSAELGAGSLSLYPVPVAEQLTVNFNAARSGEVRYRLLDLQGRLLQEQQLTIREGENISTMDMGKLGAGIYLLQVVGEQGSVSSKIVKN